MEEPGRLQSMLRVGHDWATSLSLLTFMHWRGNGNPLQCSCLENLRDGGAWWAAVYGVTQSQTRLKWLSSSMDLTFQVPMQYCFLQHWTLLLSPVTSTTGHCFCFGSMSSFFLELFLHSSPVVYGHLLTWGVHLPVHIFLPFHTGHGVLKARMLKWFAIPFSSGPRSVRCLHTSPLFGFPSSLGHHRALSGAPYALQ